MNRMKGQEKMNPNKGLPVKELKDKLDWYTLYASEEEYDEKAVECILYLLESAEPLEKGAVVCADDAWRRFQGIVREREEAESELGRSESAFEPVESGLGRSESAFEPAKAALGRSESAFKPVESGLGRSESAFEPVESGLGRAQTAMEPVGKYAKAELGGSESLGGSAAAGRPGLVGKSSGMYVSAETSRKQELSEKQELSKKRKLPKGRKVSERYGAGKSMEISEELGIMPAYNGNRAGQGSVVIRYKYIAAAVLVLLIISVVGGAQATAGPNTGFFHWLERSDKRTQMLTSPDELDADVTKDVITDVKGVSLHYDRKEAPEWAEEWLEIDEGFEMPENYEWDCFEVEEGRNFHKITSYYSDKPVSKKVLFGMVMYYGNMSFNTEGFLDYSYYDSYKIDQKEMYIYNRVEETGRKYYVIYFYDENCQFFIQGHDDLEVLKGLIEEYWRCVKKYL